MRCSAPGFRIVIVTLAAALLGSAAAAAAVPGGDRDNHATLACNGCHLRPGPAATDPRAAAERRCRSCHEARASDRGPFHAAGTAGCLECHCFHEPTRVATDQGTLDLASVGAAAAGHCRSCHADARVPQLSVSHTEAAALYHGDTKALAGTAPSQGCVNCHVREERSPWRAATKDRELTFFMHASHPQGVRVVPGSGRGAARIQAELDPRIALFDGRIECQTCHDLTNGTRFLLAAFAEQDGLCLGCHRVGPDREAAGTQTVAVLSPPR